VCSSDLGCDSTVSISLTVNPTYNTPVSASICQGDTFYYNGQFFAPQSDTLLTVHLSTINGCDSTVSISLTVHPTYNTPVSASICQGDTFYYNGQFCAPQSDTLLTVHLSTINGCDSTVSISLTVNPLPETPGAITGQSTIIESGEYTYTIASVDGADDYLYTISNSDWILSQHTTTAILTINTPGTGILAVVAVNECGTSVSSTLEISSTVGIFQIGKGELRIYPNPTDGKLQVIYDGLQEIKTIEIYDAFGKLQSEIVNLKSKNTTLDMSKYADGLYFLRIYGNKNELIGIQKIIKSNN
jgi:hypothetical protein